MNSQKIELRKQFHLQWNQKIKSVLHGAKAAAVLPKLICRFCTIHIKIPAAAFQEIDSLTLKFIRKCQGPKVAETVLEQKNRIGELNTSPFLDSSQSHSA